MTRQVEIPVTVPSGDSACGEVLRQTLLDHRGVVSAAWNPVRQVLTLEYLPERISLAQVEEVAEALGASLEKRYERCTLRLAGMNCTECALSLERDLKRLPGVPWVAVDFPGSVVRAEVEADGARAQLERRIAELGFASQVPAEKDTGLSERQRMVVLTAVCLIALAIGAFLALVPGVPRFAQVALFVLAYAAGGYYSARNAIAALREKTVDVNLLMVTAALGAAGIDHWQEGAILMFLFSLSNTLESYAMARTRRAIRALMELSPEEARVRRNGEEDRIPVAHLQVGDLVIVGPAERIPVDGQVLAGRSGVDESSLTGESVPVEKGAGDPVFAGSLNQQGVLEVQMTRPASESTLARVIRLVEEAQSQKAETQHLTDWIGRYYTLAVLGGAVLFLVTMPVFLGWPFVVTFYRTMTLLVVASPCALVISIPAAILSAIAGGARDGILFKGGVTLEQAAAVRVVALDKTGTLTEGRPRVTDVVSFGAEDEATVLSLAAAVEIRSEHHLGRAVVEAARERGVPLVPADEVETFPGRGIRGIVGGRRIWVGSPGLMRETSGPLDPAITSHLQALESQGKTVVVVGAESPLGLIVIADTVRPGARQIVEGLRRQGITELVMLTGDNGRVAKAVAAEVDISEWRAALLPEQKVTAVRELIATRGPVAMLGDGVNDAPALAAATVGVAMGGAGTDVALETADVVLMADDLTKLPRALALSRRCRRVILQNLAFSGCVILGLVASTLIGWMTLPLGVVGHEGSTLLVVANGLRLLRRPTM
ncbi:MAG: heavy metal translocating P-type ATPase [Candidatus Methylomirabilales bacterium]